MAAAPLYSIGHGRKPAELFLARLQEHNIRYLVDVRSRPYSRFNPQYNRERLRSFLQEHGIRYVFMGDTLGGRPEDPSCYDPSGKVSYDTMMTKPFFREGIARLKAAYEQDARAAIMCSESDPAQCHRTHLIGRVLTQEGIPLVHIGAAGGLKDQAQVLAGRKGGKEPGLFDSE